MKISNRIEAIKALIEIHNEGANYHPDDDAREFYGKETGARYNRVVEIARVFVCPSAVFLLLNTKEKINLVDAEAYDAVGECLFALRYNVAASGDPDHFGYIGVDLNSEGDLFKPVYSLVLCNADWLTEDLVELEARLLDYLIDGSPDWENIAFNNDWTSFDGLDENEKTTAKFKFPKLFDETEGLPYGYYFETDQAGDVFKYAEAEDGEQLCRDLSLGLKL